MIMKFLEGFSGMAIDLGTANTIVYQKVVELF